MSSLVKVFLAAVLPIILDGAVTTGIATVYGTGDGGNCGYGTVPTSIFPFGNIVAVGSDLWSNGLRCGDCFEVRCIVGSNTNNCPIKTCKDTSVIVQAVDQCPECSNTHLDLSTLAFQAITASSGCIIDVQFEKVACPLSDDIIIKGKGGSSRYHVELFVLRLVYSVEEVAVRDNRNTWFPCTHVTGQGFYLCNGGKPYADGVALDIRLLGSNGETLYGYDIFTDYTGNNDFGSNFAGGITAAPVEATTPSPVSSGNNNNGNGGGIVITLGDPENIAYYMVIFITNVACGGIDSIELKDQGSYTGWYGNTAKYGTTEFQFNNNGNAFTAPMALRITNSNGQVITTDYVITQLSNNLVFNLDYQFCEAGATIRPTNAPVKEPTAQPVAPTTRFPTSAGQSGETCFPQNQMNWQSYNNQIYLNGVRYNMKGTAWFGFDTDTFVVHGLADWAGGNSYIAILDFLASNGFNAIRLPFSYDAVVNNPTISSSQYNGAGNSIFSGKKVLDAMEIIIDAAADRDIMIMLDFHCVNAGSYTDGFDTLGSTLTAKKNSGRAVWEVLGNKFGSKWNIFMADLFNEPHDAGNDDWDDWIEWCQYVSNLLINMGVNWLFAVQGTNYQCNIGGNGCVSQPTCNWGENLVQLNCGLSQRVILDEPDRVVYSPHVYGPAIGGNQYGSSVWSKRWGFIADGSSDIQAAIVVGEFGSKLMDSGEIQWMNELVDYLISIDQRNTFFWCLNSNSGDTGGLISGWNLNSPETAKLTKLAELQPIPSTVTNTLGNVCISGISVDTPSPTSGNVNPQPTTARPTSAPTYSLNVCTDARRRRRLSGSNIILANSSPQIYYLQFELQNLECASISTVYIKDSGSYTTWYEKTNGWGCCNFQFAPLAETPYTYPISVRIVSSDDVEIIVTNAIRNLVTLSWDLGTNFCGDNGGGDITTTSPVPSPTSNPVQQNEPTPSPTDRPTNRPTPSPTTRPATYSFSFTVTMSLSNGNNLPANNILIDYAIDVTQLLLSLDDTFAIDVDITTKTSSSLVLSITVNVDIQECQMAIEQHIDRSTSFNADFATQFQNKLNQIDGNNVIITQNAGIEVIYNKADVNDAKSDAFWKKVTNILLIIICSLIGLILILIIAFCLFCRVHSKKMRTKIRQSVSRRFSKHTKTNTDDTINDTPTDNVNIGMNTGTATTKQAIVAADDDE